MSVEWLTGDAVDHVRALPDNSVDLVATSPPFLWLRNYNDLPGQWGSEPTPAAFLDNLLDLVESLAPKLAEHGSIAFELGDTFAGSGGAGGDYNDDGWRAGQPRLRSGSAQKSRGRNPKAGDDTTDMRPVKPSGFALPLAKSLTGVPTLFAWSLAYGRNLLRPERTIEPWRIRNVIVWARANPPVGALGDKYRPATSYITVATKSGKRWFDLDAVREPHKTTLPNGKPSPRSKYPGNQMPGERAGTTLSANTGSRNDDGTPYSTGPNPAGAPPLDHCNDTEDLTWHINTHGSGLAHYAMWPPTLAERLILSMCPAQVCTECGEPRRRITERTPEYQAARDRVQAGLAATGNHYNEATGRNSQHLGNNVLRDHFAGGPLTETVGWSDCGHNNYRPGLVLDPFAGTGTTLAVADIHGRDATGIDLDPHNPDLYEARYAECWRALKPEAGLSPVSEHGEQLRII